jgi:short subunit dehydrogenase-like uncharacterized protein
MNTYLIYGANGYTGRLIARQAVVRGHRPILAGRSEEPVRTLARELGLEHRIFDLQDANRVRQGLQGALAVLHCAGPFARTAHPMVEACLEEHIHYLDITGEISVFEMLAGREPEAVAANIFLLPGVGFDVVPSDCLAAHLKRRLPSATHLTLGFETRGRISRGTATTMVENLPRGGAIRQGGKILSVPAAWKSRVIDFGRGQRQAMTIPWGDISTAYHSTGIPNIEVYMACSGGQRFLSRMSNYLGWLFRYPSVQRFLIRRLHGSAPGPSDEQRARGESLLWGEVANDKGDKAIARLRVPEGYTCTVHAALAVMDRVLAGWASPGFQTPSLAFGPDFVLELPGVLRTDEPT